MGGGASSFYVSLEAADNVLFRAGGEVYILFIYAEQNTAPDPMKEAGKSWK